MTRKHIFVRAPVVVVFTVSSITAAPAVLADDGPDLRIEVTGSNLKRLDGETASPVQVITRGEIERQGILTAAQLLDRISANASFNSYNEAQAIGDAAQPGFAGASLRGLGYARTLVLLNGRRVANYALNSAGVDLNAIPLAAIERVEILKDGASAVYGSDAIAGIVNFITRTSYEGAEALAYGGATQRGGAGVWRAGGSAGTGDLARDGYNVSATVDYQDYAGLAAIDRPYARTAYIPGVLDATSAASLPANVDIPGVTGTRNPAYPACDPPRSFPTPAGPLQCRYDYARAIDVVPPSQRFNAIGNASIDVTRDVRAFAEAAYSHNRFVFRLSPTPISSATTLHGDPFLLPPTSPFYPAAFVAASGGDPTRPVSVLWRADELGSRTDVATSEQSRIVAGLDGRAHGWDFATSLQYNASKVTDRYTRGWVRESAILPLLDSGRVDPFGPNTPDVLAALRATAVDQDVRHATGTTYAADGKIARDIEGLPVGPSALALGVDWRRERLVQRSADILESGDILASGGTIPSIEPRTRDVAAAYAEFEARPLRGLGVNVAVREDHYSDFGSTTSPKIGVRWQPHATLLVRGTWGSGFRAPSLQGLYQPPVQTNTAGVWDDPLRCPVTHSANDCAVQFNALVGGNPALRPERSRQYAYGIAWSPVPELGVTLSRWHIEVRDLIATLTDQAVFTQFGQYGATNIRRGAPDAAYPGLPGPILAVLLPTTNYGRQEVRGVDVDAHYDLGLGAAGRVALTFSGTYLDSYRQTTPDGEFPDFAGARGAVGAIPRWRHNLAATWSRSAWSATLAQNYQLGYDEPDAVSGVRRVGSYSLWDLQAQYAGWKDVALAAGVRNLFDTNPPVSNQNQAFQVGYDPTYVDPRGRLFYASLRYAFR